jgi:hypothetical protein
MSDQDKQNLELAVRLFGMSDRKYRFVFTGSGMVITVSWYQGNDIAQVCGKGEITRL